MQRPSTGLDYAQRIARVVDHIARHLDTPLDVAGLAEIACFSPFHFHRIYRTQTGETIAQTVRRYRLHRAAAQLVGEELPVPRIARRAGYASTEAFTRAFAAHYGIPPAAFRALPRDPVLCYQTQQGDETVMENLQVRIEDMDTLRLAGIPHKGPYIEIGSTFEKTFAFAGGAGLLGPSMRMIGLYYDDPNSVPARNLNSFAAITLPDGFAGDLPAGLELREMPAGRHAVAIHKGPYADLHVTWDRLFSAWLPQSGEEPDDRPTMEEYLNNPRETPQADFLTAVCLPLKG